MNLKWLLNKKPKKLADVKKVELNFTKIDWELMNEEPWSGNYNDRLHRHGNDAVDAIASYVYNACNVNDFIKDEWIKANPNLHKTKKWEEFKDMKKKELRNVGFENNVIVPVDVKTNLASIDADALHSLYVSRDNAKANWNYYRGLCTKKDLVNDKLRDDNKVLMQQNTELEEENSELKKENERLKAKVTRLQVMTNSVYGLPNMTLCCCRHHGESYANAFAKAAKALAEHVKAGKPTYDQLLEENEKLKRENHSFRRGQESLEAEVDELDKECDALVEEKEKLQAKYQQAINREDMYKGQRDSLSAEVDKLLDELIEFKKENDELKKKTSVEEYMKLSDLQNATRDENTKLKMEVVKLREMNERVCKANERLIVELTADDLYRGKYENEVEINKELSKELEKYKKQCNRLSNEKINAWSSTHDNLNNANEKIKKLEAECAKWKNNFYKVCEEYTVYQKETRDNQNYYKLWKDLADKYCKLEDQYKVAVALGDKLLKQVTDLEKEKELASDSCESSGTGCCFKE